MNESLNALLAAAVLTALVLQCLHLDPDPAARLSSAVRAAGRALIGCGLVGFVLAPVAGELNDGAQTALLVGLSLQLVRWRRRSESGR